MAGKHGGIKIVEVYSKTGEAGKAGKSEKVEARQDPQQMSVNNRLVQTVDQYYSLFLT